MRNVQTIYAGNDSVIALAGLRDALTGDDITGALVTVTLLDASGAPVAGTTWPKTCSESSVSPGTYRAVLPGGSMSIAVGDQLTARIVADGGSGLGGQWDVPVAVGLRRA